MATLLYMVVFMVLAAVLPWEIQHATCHGEEDVFESVGAGSHNSELSRKEAGEQSFVGEWSHSGLEETVRHRC